MKEKNIQKKKTKSAKAAKNAKASGAAKADKANKNKTDKKAQQTSSKKAAKKTKSKAQKKKAVASVKVIPLGGLGEIGKNMTAIEYEDEIIIVDCGLCFPDDDMFGIDKVIPDFDYLINSDKKIRGLIITHGHEDHIGAIPFLLKELNIPVYGLRFPLGLISAKLKEYGLHGDLRVIQPEQVFRVGRHFTIEPLRITHSIADSVCYSIKTPAGRIFHTGDFKIDFTPVDGNPIDFARLAQIGMEGVLLMLAESTNVLREGYTQSEKVVGKALEDIFRQAKNRIIIATFSSNVHRIQKIIDIALLCKRKVAISGRSMVNVVDLARELGYIKIPDKMLVDLNKASNIPDKELVVITTGSQGEPMSALARMASADHRSVQIKKNDTVILSSTPVPGNELTVSNVVNQLVARGADVIYSDIAETHVSGHACQEELKLMHSLIRPRYFMPVHGEARHLYAHAKLAEELGMPHENIFILNNGDQLAVSSKGAEKTEKVAHADGIFVDGLGVGDVGNIVLRDRHLLSESGLIIVVAAIDRASRQIISGPDIISRGFVYVRENEDLIDAACDEARKIIEDCLDRNVRDWNSIKTAVREQLRKYIQRKTGRYPVILPIFQEI